MVSQLDLSSLHIALKYSYLLISIFSHFWMPMLCWESLCIKVKIHQHGYWLLELPSSGRKVKRQIIMPGTMQINMLGIMVLICTGCYWIKLIFRDEDVRSKKVVLKDGAPFLRAPGRTKPSKGEAWQWEAIVHVYTAMQTAQAKERMVVGGWTMSRESCWSLGWEGWGWDWSQGPAHRMPWLPCRLCTLEPTGGQILTALRMYREFFHKAKFI